MWSTTDSVCWHNGRHTVVCQQSAVTRPEGNYIEVCHRDDASMALTLCEQHEIYVTGG